MNTTKTMHKIVIVKAAFDVLSAEVASWKQHNTECGGSLVGFQTENASYVLYAITTGPAAKQSWGGVTTDCQYQTRCLQAICNYYLPLGIRLYYLGDYHLHPMYLPSLSGTDTTMLTELLHDPDHAYLCGTPHILVTYKAEEAMCLPMWITRDKTSVAVEKACLEEVPSDHPTILRGLHGHTYVPYENILSGKAAPDQADPAKAQVQATMCVDSLQQRLELELEEIRRVFGIECQARRGDHVSFYIPALIEKHTLLAAIPSEFPLNPPIVFIKRAGQCEFEEVCTALPWNSLARIADIFEEAVQSKRHARWFSRASAHKRERR